jgi:hypothetical protein
MDDVSLQIDCVTDPKNISRSSSDDDWVLIDEIFVVDRGATTRLTDTGTDISRKRQSETLRLPDTDTGTDISRKRQSETLRLPDTDTGTDTSCGADTSPDTSPLTLTSIGDSNVHMNVHPPK